MMERKRLSNKKRTGRMILCGIIGLCLFLLCNRFIIVDGRYEDIREKGEAVNLTSYVFDYSRKRVMEVLDSSFSPELRHHPPGKMGRYPAERVRGYALCYLGAKNDKGLELSRFGSYFINPTSYVYREKKTGQFLPSSFLFRLEVVSLDSARTRVDVMYKKSSSRAGYYFAYDPHLMNFQVPRYLDLGSTTIEEYEILRYVGKMLGQKGMPPIHYPKSVTILELRRNFLVDGGQTFPFTGDEFVFGYPGGL